MEYVGVVKAMSYLIVERLLALMISDTDWANHTLACYEESVKNNEWRV